MGAVAGVLMMLLDALDDDCVCLAFARRGFFAFCDLGGSTVNISCSHLGAAKEGVTG